MFLTAVGCALSRELVRMAKAMLTTRDIYFDDNSTTLTFPNGRWSFNGSDSKQYLGQSSYLVRDEIASFDPYTDWKSSIDACAIKYSGPTIFLIINPSAKLGSAAHQVFTEPDNKSLHNTSTGRYRAFLQRTSESYPMMYD